MCGGCGVEMNVQEKPENYFFTCITCQQVGNLPGLLAMDADNNLEGEARHERLVEIAALYIKPVDKPVEEPYRKG